MVIIMFLYRTLTSKLYIFTKNKRVAVGLLIWLAKFVLGMGILSKSNIR